MIVESRQFKNEDGSVVDKVVLICESDEESAIIDLLGDDFSKDDGIPVSGEIRLSDGYGEHYILLGKPEKK